MPLDPVKILLVDDRPANLFALEQVLAAPGLEVVKAESGAQALAFLLRAECAVILMDVSMPGMDGYETARLVRRNPRTRDIPIVFVTAMAQDERNVLDGYECGAIDYLVKPVRPEVLRSKVEGFVTLHRARLEIRRQAELLREHERRRHVLAVAELEVKALQRQQAAQRRYQTLVEGLSRAIAWIADPVTLAPKLVGPAARALLGIDPEWWSAAPRSIADRIPTPDRERLLEAVRGLGPGGPPASVEHRMIAESGRALWFETTVRLIAGEDPGSSELHGLSSDVTEAVEARDSSAFLARASAELSASLDLDSTLRTAVRLPLGILAEWCLVETTLGDEPPRALGAHASAAQDEAVSRAAPSLALARLRATDRPALASARNLFAPDPGGAAALDRLGPSRALAVPLSVHGARVGTLCLFSADALAFEGSAVALADELGRRVAQAIENAVLHEQTRAAVRAREEFLSVASHELRTPLTALGLQTRLVDQLLGRMDLPPGDAAELRRRVLSMQRQVGRLAALAHSVLDLTQIRSGRMSLSLGPCNLAEVVRDVGARFEDALRADGRTLTVDAPPRLDGRWDATRLEQLITNLVANALRHGGRGAVSVTAGSGADGMAVVTVSDSGPGIPPSEHSRIFDAFAQGRRAGSGGLGLGLYIARTIAHAHRGRISLESAEGHGATFRVELPLEGAPAHEVPRGAAGDAEVAAAR